VKLNNPVTNYMMVDRN